ncbi:TetR family transcriptional regulator [Streptomyces sp. NBC_00503]|uniref:TetR family transcriptional regulator n=1 Tax=Streptomyces sp. NBC_00503 TaxID=2903659 RepID=UPI002E812D93|nr:TetR family transcriptional regulator [Streptomyces sp. NBC_00503]WUD82264.1 TetR family transcriptional regulator [Streptomyces sp. NBC_00503]
MAWDTERTKKLLLDAAIEEFAAKGPEAARVAAIATRAGVNKERIYQYFGNKESLFGAVLECELSRLADAVPLTGESAADLGDYTARVFDYHRRNPHFLRLLAWEGLHRGEAVAAEDERTGHYARKVAAIGEAQDAGALTGDVPAGHLMYAVIALTAGWFNLPQLVRMVAPETAGAGPEEQREALVGLVRRLAAGPSADSGHAQGHTTT